MPNDSRYLHSLKKKKPKLLILDKNNLWMLVRRKAHPGKPAGVVYMLACSRYELWRRVVDQEYMGTGMNKKALMRDGWRAEKVIIAVER